MSVYSELLEKAANSAAKSLKKLAIILILLVLAALVAAYFIGRHAGAKAAVSSSDDTDRMTVCDGKDDACPDPDDGNATFVVPDHSGMLKEIVRKLEKT